MIAGPHTENRDRAPGRRVRRRRLAMALLLPLSLHGYGSTADNDLPLSQLADLSLEELMEIEVTSVSRGGERLLDAAAAIAVVTNSDIRRSGATTIPEALRMVPGLHVASQDASRWAVSSRGFSSSNSEKLLVLSDTRSLYTPLFSGVFWDVQDYLLNDIERIEVIRGPGAALWGSNAVNGVINITTKSARDTQGLYVEATAGTEDQAIGAARYGGQLGEDLYYRVYGKYSKYDQSYAPYAESDDAWALGHIGFRADWEATGRDTVTVQGDIYDGRIGELVPPVRITGRAGPQGDLETDVNGGNILARWERRIDEQSDFKLRAYYDETERDGPSYHDQLETFDIDFQHRFMLARRHEITWGLNYRHTESHTVGTGLIMLDPALSRDELFSLFVQDKVAFTDTVQLTVGSKYEHNDFSGTELQPSVRLAWNLSPRQMIWGAVSKAVRVPTRYERDVSAVASAPGTQLIRLEGNPDFDSEELVAYELGYRWQPLDSLSIDLAAFHNRYDELAAVRLEGDMLRIDPDSGAVIITQQNTNDGRAQGLEAQVTFSPLANWRLTASYSYLDMHVDTSASVYGDNLADINRNAYIEGSTPRNQFGLRSSLDLTGDIQLDVMFRYLSRIRSMPEIRDGDRPGAGPSSYAELDIRIARRFGRHLELSLVGQNLLDHRHAEFGAPYARGEMERSIYGKVAYQF